MPDKKAAKEMTLADVPEGMRPEAFLTDRKLAELYDRELAALSDDDPGYAEMRQKRNSARRAADMTDAMIEQAQADEAAQKGGKK